VDDLPNSLSPVVELASDLPLDAISVAGLGRFLLRLLLATSMFGVVVEQTDDGAKHDATILRLVGAMGVEWWWC